MEMLKISVDVVSTDFYSATIISMS